MRLVFIGLTLDIERNGMNTDDNQQPINELRSHAARSTLADVLSDTGCPFPNATVDLLLARLHDAGFYLVR